MRFTVPVPSVNYGVRFTKRTNQDCNDVIDWPVYFNYFSQKCFYFRRDFHRALIELINMIVLAASDIAIWRCYGCLTLLRVTSCKYYG